MNGNDTSIWSYLATLSPIKINGQRKPDGSARRRELCDAAIEILGHQGAKGLSHVKVDRQAGVADGSTSFYFRTRSALLLAAAERMAERDREELLAVINLVRNDDAAIRRSPSALAIGVVAAGSEPYVFRTKARYELFLEATRDPELATLLKQTTTLYNRLLREYVIQLQAGEEVDDALVEHQATAAVAFVGGVIEALTAGMSEFRNPEKIDQVLFAIVHGLRVAYENQAGVGELTSD